MQAGISVIIPTYNRSELLVEAVASVLEQGCHCKEILVIDDGSTDQTAERVAAIASIASISVRYYCQENKGVAAARNVGIREAIYDYLAFLDSDDLWLPGKLQRQYSLMKENPHALICHTAEKWLRRGSHLNQKKKHLPRGGDIFKQSLQLCAVGMSTVMMKKELFTMVGNFDESFPCCEDYELWLRISARYPFLLLDEPLTVKRGGRQDQLSSRYAVGMDRFRILAMEKLLDSQILTRRQRNTTLQELARKLTIYGNGCLRHSKRKEGERCLARAREIEQRRQQ